MLQRRMLDEREGNEEFFECEELKLNHLSHKQYTSMKIIETDLDYFVFFDYTHVLLLLLYTLQYLL